jgi:hypothetical protein
VTIARLVSFAAQNKGRIRKLADRLGSYEPQSVDEASIVEWIGQFARRDYELALSALETLWYCDMIHVQRLLRRLHDLLMDGLSDDKADLTDCLFLPVNHITESGPVFTRLYQKANKLNKKQFCQRSEVQQRIFDAKKTKKNGRLPRIVLIDDFAGTGDQIVHQWNTGFASFVDGDVPVLLLLLAGCREGAEHIESETPIDPVVVGHYIKDKYRLDRSHVFDDASKARLRQYCTKAGNMPLGFGDLGLLMSFYHETPNNTISVFRGSKKQSPWKGLLPRYEDL